MSVRKVGIAGQSENSSNAEIHLKENRKKLCYEVKVRMFN